MSAGLRAREGMESLCVVGRNCSWSEKHHVEELMSRLCLHPFQLKSKALL